MRFHAYSFFEKRPRELRWLLTTPTALRCQALEDFLVEPQ